MPVFMNVWAGSWLIASVRSERTMQMSSAIVPNCGKMSQISCPDSPYFLKRMLRSKALQLLALKLRDRLALGKRLGHRLAVHLGQLGLVVERFQVRRPARHRQKNDPLGSRCNVQRIDDAAT